MDGVNAIDLKSVLEWLIAGGAPIAIMYAISLLAENWSGWHTLPKSVKFLVPMILSAGLAIGAQVLTGYADVVADIAGFIARVKVTQTFINPTNEKTEAVYVFPLPHEAAVDDMTMVIAQRRIVGVIQRREEARRIYEQALLAGQTAALLEQERPNIFTQSVGNIGPGQEVNIEISYVDVLRYDVGSYEFQFPMVVGPRYNPGAPIAAPQPNPQELQGKVSPPTPDTTRVPDASRISPPVLKPGVRNGHDITLRVKLDAGVPVSTAGAVDPRSFQMTSGGSAVQIQVTGATDGIFTMDIAATANCNRCHDPVALHGGNRREVQYCVTCHNPGSTDANSGNTVDLKVMIHKIHMGANLPSVQAGEPYIIWGFNNSVHDYSNVLFPQDIRNCVNCHAGSATGTDLQFPAGQDYSLTLTSQGDNWANYASQAACGSCHDALDFSRHRGGQTDDSKSPNPRGR